MFLEKQIELINDIMKRSSALSNELFAGAMFYGLAQIETETDDDGDRRFPITFNESGMPISVGIDDRPPLLLYHRHIGSAFESVRSDYGDTNDRIKESAEMIMVVYGNRSRLRMSAESLSSLINLATPTNIDQTLLSGIKIDAMNVVLNRIETDAQNVFNDEFAGVDFTISANEIMFKVNYSIATQFRRDCFNFCDCVFPQ